jgi:hypothetical protein
MKTLTIRISDSLHISLAAEAEKMGASISEIARNRMSESPGKLTKKALDESLNFHSEKITSSIQKYLQDNFDE